MVDPRKRRSSPHTSYNGTYRSTRLGRAFTTIAILPLGLMFVGVGLWCGCSPKGTLENRAIFLTICPAFGFFFAAFWWHVQVLRLEILDDRFRLRGIRGTREYLNAEIGGYTLIDVGMVTGKEFAHLFDVGGRRVAILPYWFERWPSVKSWLAATFRR